MSKEFDYTKLKHVTSVDQSDRQVPYNLRQSGPTKVEMLISTRVRKSPYWHLSMQAGCWRATVYNRIYQKKENYLHQLPPVLAKAKGYHPYCKNTIIFHIGGSKTQLFSMSVVRKHNHLQCRW